MVLLEVHLSNRFIPIKQVANGSELMKKIRVLCVDDSALVRKLMFEIINKEPDMEVVAQAPDPLIARELIKQHNPDVLTLDVEMPRMDGLDFLERLMRLRPMPVVMVSSLTQRNSDVTIRALELGAIDFVAKPQMGLQDGLRAYGQEIVEKIRIAANAQVRAHRAKKAPSSSSQSSLSAPYLSTEKIIAIGASTGGTEAIRQVLEPLPSNTPAILITQHMPAGFTRSFVHRLDALCAMRVHEAEDGQRVLPGHVYIAPGGVAHMLLRRSGANYVIGLEKSEPVNRHRPSVDVLFYSVAKHAGANAVGLVLTGMGKDGAQGLLAMRKAGAHTFAQDEATSVVFGMPKEALAIEAASKAVALNQISGELMASLKSAGNRV